jgi:hypothetical protein
MFMHRRRLSRSPALCRTEALRCRMGRRVKRRWTGFSLRILALRPDEFHDHALAAADGEHRLSIAELNAARRASHR